MHRLLLSLIFLLSLIYPALAYKVAVVTYTTTASPSDNRDITVTPSFPIHVVMIKCSAAQSTVWSVTGMGADATSPLNIAGDSFADGIQSMGTGTVQVGLHARVQPPSETCWLVAFGDDGRGDLAYGVYTGNSTDDRTNAFTLSFQPDLVMINCYTGTCGTGAVIRTSQHSGDSTSRLAISADVTNRIQGFTATGVTLGNDVLVNTGHNYAYVAVKSLPLYNASVSYTGNTTDNVDIATIANPIFMIAKANSATTSGCARWASTGDVSWLVSATASAPNLFQAFTSTGFQRGTAACASEDTIVTRAWVTKQPIYRHKTRTVQ